MLFLFCFDLDYFLVIYVLLTVLSLELCIVIYFVEDPLDPLKNKTVYLKGLSLSNFEINKQNVGLFVMFQELMSDISGRIRLD